MYNVYKLVKSDDDGLPSGQYKEEKAVDKLFKTKREAEVFIHENFLSLPAAERKVLGHLWFPKNITESRQQ